MRWQVRYERDMPQLHMLLGFGGFTNSLMPLPWNCILVDEWCSTNTRQLGRPVILIWSFHFHAFQLMILNLHNTVLLADIYTIHFPVKTRNPTQIVGNILQAPLVCYSLTCLLEEPSLLLLATVSRFGKDKGDDLWTNQIRNPFWGQKKRINSFRDIKSLLFEPEYTMKMWMRRSICLVVKIYMKTFN